jgi:hypothetical protein
MVPPEKSRNVNLRQILHKSGQPALLAFLLFHPSPVQAKDPDLLDLAAMASPRSRAAHQVRFTHAEVYDRRFEVGALTLPIAGVRVSPGGTLHARMKAGDGRPHTVQLIVTLATPPPDYGRRQCCRVQLNGVEVFQSAERDSGGGATRSLLFEVPGLHRSVDLDVAATAESEAPVTVVSFRWYETADDGIVRDAFTAARMGLALLTSKGYGYYLDAPTIREITALQPQSPFLSPEIALVYNFCSRDSAENRKEIDRLAGLAEQTGIPLRIAFQVHWGGVPVGVPDSGGVAWSDPPYQMVVYDPDDQTDDPGLAALLGDRYDVRFGLSVPNVWSDTPWLTFNNARLNRFRRTRLNNVLAAWHAARERLRSSGRANLLPPQISTGEETVYWAKGVEDSKYTKLNGGKPRSNLMADFNPSSVADALRDGVVLDPRDGLDLSERWWLHQNLAHWQQTLVDWMMGATPPDPIRVRNEKPEFAPDLVRRNVFTEPYALPLYPMMDLTHLHPGLEVGYVRDGRSGGEYWSGSQMLLWLQKEREWGRIALPNIECTVTDDAQLVACLRAAYAMGARFSTVYNWHPRPNAAALLKRFADSIDVPPSVAWLPVPDGGEQRGAGRAGSSVSTLRRYMAPDVGFGVNRVELFPRAGAVLPPRVRITLRDVEPGAQSSVSLTIATAANRSGTVVATLPGFFRQMPGRQYELVVEGRGNAGAGFAVAPDGRIAARLTSDILRERWRSHLIGDWQDAKDIIASLKRLHAASTQSRYAAEALAGAERLFSAGRVREAYRAAIRAEQIALPAAYEIGAPGGRLTPYPAEIRCPLGPVRVVIRSWDSKGAAVSIRSVAGQSVTLRLGASRNRVNLAAGEEKVCIVGAAPK